MRSEARVLVITISLLVSMGSFIHAERSATTGPDTSCVVRLISNEPFAAGKSGRSRGASQQNKKAERPHIGGTGIFAKLGEKYYIITAYHVVHAIGLERLSVSGGKNGQLISLADVIGPETVSQWWHNRFSEVFVFLCRDEDKLLGEGIKPIVFGQQQSGGQHIKKDTEIVVVGHNLTAGNEATEPPPVPKKGDGKVLERTFVSKSWVWDHVHRLNRVAIRKTGSNVSPQIFDTQFRDIVRGFAGGPVFLKDSAGSTQLCGMLAGGRDEGSQDQDTWRQEARAWVIPLETLLGCIKQESGTMPKVREHSELPLSPYENTALSNGLPSVIERGTSQSDPKDPKPSAFPWYFPGSLSFDKEEQGWQTHKPAKGTPLPVRSHIRITEDGSLDGWTEFRPQNSAPVKWDGVVKVVLYGKNEKRLWTTQSGELKFENSGGEEGTPPMVAAHWHASIPIEELGDAPKGSAGRESPFSKAGLYCQSYVPSGVPHVPVPQPSPAPPHVPVPQPSPASPEVPVPQPSPASRQVITEQPTYYPAPTYLLWPKKEAQGKGPRRRKPPSINYASPCMPGAEFDGAPNPVARSQRAARSSTDARRSADLNRFSEGPRIRHKGQTRGLSGEDSRAGTNRLTTGDYSRGSSLTPSNGRDVPGQSRERPISGWIGNESVPQDPLGAPQNR